MANGYEHSRVFAQLKGTIERIPTNLSTFEYLTILDSMLSNAVSPIVLRTNYVNNVVAGMIGWQERNRKRKLSSGVHQDFRNRALVWLMTHSAEDRAASFSLLRIDRALVMMLCEQFLSRTQRYADACNGELKDDKGKLLPALRQQMVASEEERILGTATPIHSIRRDVAFWLACARDYREKIAEKYTRLALSAAQRDYVHFHHCALPLDDVSQTYVASVSRAIDRCDHRLGVLTTQVQYALLTARTSVQKSRSFPYEPLDSPELSLSTESAEHDLDQEQRVRELSRYAALFDAHGAARALLGLTATP